MGYNIAFTGNVFPFGEGMAYGGERILYYLIQDLAKLGHNVYLFATEGTNVPSKYLKDFVPTPMIHNEIDENYEAVCRYEEKHKVKFDVYQCNYFGEGWNPECLRFPYVELTWCVWCHLKWQLNASVFNTISYSGLMHQDFRNCGVNTVMIHYGLPKDLYQFEPDAEDYCVWIGKIEGGKAPHLAIKLAQAAGLKIVLLGPPYNTGCFWKDVAPYVDNKTVFWLRGVDDAMKQKVMSKARCFISSNDNTWREHFGIVNIEAQAMGVPVIAFNRIGQECAIWTDKMIVDGKHGFFLNYHDSNNVSEIIEKGLPLMSWVSQIDRKDCRANFEERFTSEIMARNYVEMYDRVVAGEQLTKRDW